MALFATAACGGGDSKDKTGNAVSDGAGALSKLAANSAAANVCGGRAAVNIGLAFQSALSKTDTNYDDIADALQKAADAAPSEIKDDFQVVADAEGPFLQVLARTEPSQYGTLYQNEEYLSAISKLGSEAFTTASANINTWFTEHCK